MPERFGYVPCGAEVAYAEQDYYLWDGSVVFAEGRYHMFCSRWPKELGFGWNWLFNSEIVHAVADHPQGPYRFLRVVLPRRGREYFDGMNTHNACIRQYGGKFYLYYMGTTYGGDIPWRAKDISYDYAMETWNRKRIGVAVADGIYGEFIRRDEPLLQPRGCSHWDCTVTTNPAPAILPSGKTYLLYKSRRSVGKPLQLGVAVADAPDGAFSRLCEGPVLTFGDENIHVEDPFLWYDEPRKVFCLLAKDDSKAGKGITGEWGAGFYAESEDCIRFTVARRPLAYSRRVRFADGQVREQCNLERPSLLFRGTEPCVLFNATGDGDAPYAFSGPTYILAQTLRREE